MESMMSEMSGDLLKAVLAVGELYESNRESGYI
jgi:hypothetical protein